MSQQFSFLTKYMTSLHFLELENIEVRFIVLCLWYGSVVACHVIFFPKTWEWGTGNVYLLPLDPYFWHMLEGNWRPLPTPYSHNGSCRCLSALSWQLIDQSKFQVATLQYYHARDVNRYSWIKFQFNSIIDVASYALYGASSDKPILFSQCEIL